MLVGVGVIVAMMAVIMFVVMLLGLHFLTSLSVDLAELGAFHLFIRFQVALFIFLFRSTGAIFVAPRLKPCLPFVIRHTSPSETVYF